MDPDDQRLDHYRDLRDPAHRARFEAQAQVFIAEGVTVVRRLLSSGMPVSSVLVLQGREGRVADVMPPNVPMLVVDDATMRTVAGFDVHRGVLACAPRPVAPALVDIAAAAHTVAVLEGLNDHENLGAIARSARALDIDALVLDPTCADPWYRRSVRVSMGELLFLPVARATRWPEDLDLLRGFEIVALTPAQDAMPLADYARQRPTRVAILLGAEGTGLSTAALDRADVRVRIPMRDDVDSLNVGHAAAIAFAALATSS